MSEETRKEGGRAAEAEGGPDVDHELDVLLEGLRDEIVGLGTQAADVFGADGRTQLSNLEQVALHATTFAEIDAFIKRQAGKEKEKKEKQGKWREIAPGLLEFTAKARDEAGKRLAGGEESEDRRRRRLLELRVPERLLGTAFRWLHSEYLYQVGGRPGGGRR